MSSSPLTTIDRVVTEHLRLIADLQAGIAGPIARAAELFADTFRSKRRVLLFGNGGSASDALHIEGELANRFRRNRRGLPALALGASLPALTSTANDHAYDEVFARLVEAHGQPGDLAVGLTTSGRSPNVVLGLERARQLGLTTIAMTGRGGAEAARHADLLLDVPSTDTARIQEAHILIGHIICRLVEDALFGGSDE